MWGGLGYGAFSIDGRESSAGGLIRCNFAIDRAIVSPRVVSASSCVSLTLVLRQHEYGVATSTLVV